MKKLLQKVFCRSLLPSLVMTWKYFLGLLQSRPHCKESSVGAMVFKARFSADRTSPCWCMPSASKMTKMPSCPLPRRTSSPTTQATLLLSSAGSTQGEGWEDQSKNEGDIETCLTRRVLHRGGKRHAGHCSTFISRAVRGAEQQGMAWGREEKCQKHTVFLH